MRKTNSLGLVFPEIPVHLIETGLQAGAAEVLAEAGSEKAPVAFANRHGKGLALYIACDLAPSFEALRGARGVGANARTMEECVRFITSLAANAGARPVLDIRDANGDLPPYLKVVNFRQGDIQYYGILREYDWAKSLAKDPTIVKIKFPVKGHVREMRSGRDLGYTDEASTVLTATTLQLYSVLPYKTRNVTVATGKRSYAPGDVVTYHVAVNGTGKVGAHTLRLNVIDPRGAESVVYSVNLTAQSGKAEGSFPLSFDDRKGKWILAATDLTSGKQTKSGFTVR